MKVSANSHVPNRLERQVRVYLLARPQHAHLVQVAAIRHQVRLEAVQPQPVHEVGSPNLVFLGIGHRIEQRSRAHDGVAHPVVEVVAAHADAALAPVRARYHVARVPRDAVETRMSGDEAVVRVVGIRRFQNGVVHVVAELLLKLDAQGYEPRRVGHRDASRAQKRQRLEVLRGPDRAQPALPRMVPCVVRDGCRAPAMLCGRPDAHDGRFLRGPAAVAPRAHLVPFAVGRILAHPAPDALLASAPCPAPTARWHRGIPPRR